MDTFLVRLTEDDILALDGRTQNPDVLPIIGRLKARRSLEAVCGSDPVGRFVAAVVEYGNRRGEIGLGHRGGICEICRRKPEIVRYKSGRRKGLVKGSVHYWVVDLQARSDVIIENTTPYGVCTNCWQAVRPRLAAVLSDRPDLCRFQWPEEIAPPHWRKEALFRCGNCGADLWEGDVGLLPALMGGQYRGKCPRCGWEDLPFMPRKLFPVPNKWRVVPLTGQAAAVGGADTD